MAGETVIETRALSKVYRDFWGRQKVRALKALDLEIKQGEIFGLLGPNGSGKTTTIKLLLGLLFPTEGQALVFGKDATDVSKNQRIGYLPEESYLYRFLNADETLEFYGRLFDIPHAELKQRIDNLITMVGLDRARKRQLKEYSKGMTRRIGLAQALINEPELILLDEPTSGLDPIGTREMKDLILKLRDEGQDGRDVQPPAGRRAGRLRPDRDPASGRIEGTRPGRRPVDRRRRDSDSRAQLELAMPGRNPPGDRAESRRAGEHRTSDDHARRVVPVDRPRQRGPAGPARRGPRRPTGRLTPLIFPGRFGLIHMRS